MLLALLLQSMTVPVSAHVPAVCEIREQVAFCNTAYRLSVQEADGAWRVLREGRGILLRLEPGRRYALTAL
jgi:hypothetical protein